jgi:hypothetical protein
MKIWDAAVSDIHQLFCLVESAPFYFVLFKKWARKNLFAAHSINVLEYSECTLGFWEQLGSPNLWGEKYWIIVHQAEKLPNDQLDYLSKHYKTIMDEGHAVWLVAQKKLNVQHIFCLKIETPSTWEQQKAIQALERFDSDNVEFYKRVDHSQVTDLESVYQEAQLSLWSGVHSLKQEREKDNFYAVDLLIKESLSSFWRFIYEQYRDHKNSAVISGVPFYKSHILKVLAIRGKTSQSASFYEKKLFACAQKYTLRELNTLYKNLCDLDLHLKKKQGQFYLEKLILQLDN